MRSTRSVRGVSDMYSRLMRWSTTPKAEADTGRLHDPTSAPKSLSREEMPEDGEPRKLRVLGKPRDKNADMEWVKANFSFEAWPTNFYRKSMTAAEIDSVLEGLPFDTIQQRFEAAKKITSQLQVAVPDRVLGSDLAELRTYLVGCCKAFDEHRPDAVYLDQQDFGPNVVIEPTVEERRALDKRNKQILRDARASEQAQMRELLG